MPKPKLSVVVISYNQEKYIAQAIESFICQKTNFPFNIVIADDASTDKTQEIIKRYAFKHKNLFSLILRKKNIGIVPNLTDALMKSEGKYIALCEGDDFWTDPNKLQKQVDFLENNPDYSLCFHPVKVFSEDGSLPDEIYPKDSDAKLFTTKKLLERNFIQTNSVVYTRKDYKNIPQKIMPLDWYLHLFHAQTGKIGFIGDVMSSYRKHSSGVWQDNKKIWDKYGVQHIEMYKQLLNLYGKDDDKKTIMKNLQHATNQVIDFSSEGVRKELIEKYPEFSVEIQKSYERALERYIKANKEVDRKIQEKNNELNSERRAHREAISQLNLVLNSKSYKLGNSIIRVPSKVKRSVLKSKHEKDLEHALNDIYKLNNNNEFKIGFIARNATKSPTSSAFLRVISPLSYGKGSKKISLKIMNESNPVLTNALDVCIVQRTAFDDLDKAKKFVSDLRLKKIKLIVDTDDAFSQLEKTHPQYEIQIDLVEALKYIIESADEVWVSTDKLGTGCKSKRTILRNSVDDRLWRIVNEDILVGSKIKFVYMGTATHDDDFHLIFPALDRLYRDHGDAFDLTVIGVAKTLPEKPWIKVLTPPSDSRMYPYFVKWLIKQGPYDIGLAPLVNSEFNKAKSDIKVLDYLSMGVLPIVSDLEPYKDHELDNFILRVGYKENDWAEKLEDVILNKEKYAKLKSDNSNNIKNYLNETRSVKHISDEMISKIEDIIKDNEHKA